MHCVMVPGVQYSGETVEDMDRREKEMMEANRLEDERQADFERQKKTPMKSMIDWAKQHGIL